MKAWFLYILLLQVARLAVSLRRALDLHHSPNTIGFFFGRFGTQSA